MRILITTGIYPPKIGGPAQYAKNLKEEFEKMGHKVTLKTFNIELKIPTGVRHIFFFLKIIPAVLSSQMILALDTYGVGFPTAVASRLFFKKNIIRTGGDFLWEQYCERHRKKVLLKNFYDTEKNSLTLKEKMIFLVTKWTLKNTTHVIFSTEWQRGIFIKAYGLNLAKTSIVENFYGPKIVLSKNHIGSKSDKKEFISSSRSLVIKNLDMLKKVLGKIENNGKKVKLFTENLPYDEFIGRMTICHAVVLISLSDISPNMILEAIRLNKPFICTREVGIYNRIKDAGIFVNPLNEQEIENAVLSLLTDEGYIDAKEKVENFNFVHTWDEISREFIEVYKAI